MIPTFGQSAAATPKEISPGDWTHHEFPADLQRFERTYFRDRHASHYFLHTLRPLSNLTPYFFPPTPPPLEDELPLLPPFASGAAAPPELAEYGCDWFYPLLGSRVAANDLPAQVRSELQAYRAEKLNLQNELRLRISALKDRTPESRARELAILANRQNPRIIELERGAEKIRTDLRRNDLLGSPLGNDEWTNAVIPRLQSKPDAADERLEAALLRGAAFYQDGLSTAQRGLLLEASVELETEANPIKIPPTHQGVWLLSFSPEPARIRLISNLPAALAQKISEYSSAKQNIKNELTSAVLANANNNPRARTAALQDLAITQAALIATVEITAEEIRRELATLPNPPGPPAPPSLTPELTARIAAYRAHKLESLKTLYAMLAGSARLIDPSAGPTTWMHDESTRLEVQTVKSKLSAVEFNTAQAKLLAGLNKEQAGIREALAEHFRTSNQPTDQKSVTDLLKDFETARQKQEIWEKYRDYQTAVLMPGLSPGQRRLLFDSAVEKLALPLPAGEAAP